MMKMKMVFIFSMLFVLTGCFTASKNYYILSMVSQPKHTFVSNKKVIGIEKISVPGYLYKRDIAIAKSSSQIVLLGGALWGEDLDVGLTNRLIGFLQKKFNHPDVYAYPWGINKQPNIKVAVQVTRFIAQADFVYLDATWSIENAKTKRRIARLFTTKVKTNTDVDKIVKAMDIAFGSFEETVAEGIRKF